MKKSKSLLFATAIFISICVGCSKDKNCKYEGHELKKSKEYWCYFEISGDIVTVDDSFCNCN